MLVTAEAGSASAVWRHTDRRLTALAVWSEKRPGLGEDAEPTLLHHRPTDRGVLGVYDGLGGAGARPAGRTLDGRRISNAFVASRLAHLTVQSWFAEHIAADGADPTLRERLGEVLSAARSRNRNKLSGTLQRDLPTTIATLEYRLRRSSVDLTVRWAGDSRCYLLTPRFGLQQLSRDDAEGDDALELLIADQPMTNLASATGDFEIHERLLDVQMPCVLMCATDGFFGYVATPAHLEYVLLQTLSASRDTAEWGTALVREVRSYTADDASLALVAFGFSSFPRMRDGFAERERMLRVEHWEPLQGLADRSALVDARTVSWLRYRDHYMYYLRGEYRDPIRSEGNRGDAR